MDYQKIINDISKLEDNWNGYNAGGFTTLTRLIDFCSDLVKSIKIEKYIISPTGRQTIQFDFYIDGKYIEFEIGTLFGQYIIHSLFVPDKRNYGKHSKITLECHNKEFAIGLINDILQEVINYVENQERNWRSKE